MNNDLVFKEHDSLIVIMNHTLKLLLKNRQMSKSSLEAGGVLIGERRDQHIIINAISEPEQGDIRKRNSINRVSPHHQVLVTSEFARSKGTQQYLGEWHTHPEDHPTPSSLDRVSWTREINSQKPMIVLIIGRKSIWVGKLFESHISALIMENDKNSI